MPIIRKQLKPSDVYPTDIRYNTDTGTVQSLINGDWVDNPAADPRNQTTFPPHMTADPNCDAAQSVADAFKRQIDGVLSAIAGSQSAFTIAGIILSLFTFGLFGIFISLALFLAHTMLNAGTISINAALTTPVYHTFMCILNCHMDGSGRLVAGSLGEVEGDIDTQIGGLGATILNAMLGLAGEGGVNNLGSIGTATGDCTDCDCPNCDVTLWDWDAEFLGGDGYASFVRDEGAATISADSFDGGAYHYWSINTKANGTDVCCRAHVSVDFGGGTPTTYLAFYIPCETTDAYTISNEGAPWVGLAVPLDHDCAAILIRANIAFTATVHLT